VSHIKSKIRKQQQEIEKEENPRTPVPKKGAVKVEPKNQATLVDVGFPNGICWPFCVKLVA